MWPPRTAASPFCSIRSCMSKLVGSLLFSNRPVGVKHFQAIHRFSVDVAHGLVLLFGIGTRGASIMGFEHEAEQSNGRPYRQRDGGSKRPNELTSSIVP